MTISLSELKAKRAAMTPGEWTIVTTHNAADVLIEVAEAALRWRDAIYGPHPFEAEWHLEVQESTRALRDALAKVKP